MTALDWQVATVKRRMARRRFWHNARQIAQKLTAVVALTGMVVVFSGATNQRPDSLEYYTVKKGDTLWSICTEYRQKDSRDPYILEFVEDVKKANPELVQNKGCIYPGQILRIDYRR